MHKYLYPDDEIREGLAADFKEHGRVISVTIYETGANRRAVVTFKRWGLTNQ